MKTKSKLITLTLVLAFCSAGVTPCSASDEPIKIVADALVLRPAGLFATAVGSVFFVACLPFSASSGTVKKTAQTLVLNPARATFKRPLGNFDAVQDSIASRK